MDVAICRDCPQQLSAFFWTLTSHNTLSSSYSFETSLLYGDCWWSPEFEANFSGHSFSVQFRVIRASSTYNCEVWYKYEGCTNRCDFVMKELFWAFAGYRCTLMFQNTEGCQFGSCIFRQQQDVPKHYRLLHTFKINDYPALLPSSMHMTVKMQFEQTNMLCTPCAKAADHFTGLQGRTYHEIFRLWPMIIQQDLLSRLPREIFTKIMGYVGADYHNFKIVAGVCAMWWQWAYSDFNRSFGYRLTLSADFNYLNSPNQLRVILAVCGSQIQQLHMDLFLASPSTHVNRFLATRRYRQKLNVLMEADLPKLVCLAVACQSISTHSSYIGFACQHMHKLNELSFYVHGSDVFRNRLKNNLRALAHTNKVRIDVHSLI